MLYLRSTSHMPTLVVTTWAAPSIAPPPGSRRAKQQIIINTCSNTHLWSSVDEPGNFVKVGAGFFVRQSQLWNSTGTIQCCAAFHPALKAIFKNFFWSCYEIFKTFIRWRSRLFFSPPGLIEPLQSPQHSTFLQYRYTIRQIDSNIFVVNSWLEGHRRALLLGSKSASGILNLSCPYSSLNPLGNS